MRHLKKLAGLTNLGFRASTLVFRFLLTFYIVKYLGYEATGVYGLTVGAIGIVPAVFGWGLNYFVSREIVGNAPAFATGRIKSRLFVTTVSLAAATFTGASIFLGLGYQLTPLYVLIVILLWLETYGLDIHMPLISMEMAVQANVIVFLRSALWVPFATGLGILFPAFRTLEMLFLFWICSYALAAGALVYFLRRWPLKEAISMPVEYDWLRERLRHSWHIYISDLSIVGLAYADRYIVSYLLGLTLTGIYTFFWSLTNALQTLMQTAVIQLALPRLIKAFTHGAMKEWSAIFREQFIKTIIFATALGVGVFIAAEILIRVMNMTNLSNHRGLFVLLLAAAIIRSCSDLLNIALTSLRMDGYYAAINLGGVCVSIAIAGAMIYLFGLLGTGIAALMTALLLLAVRAFFVVRCARMFALRQL